MSGFQIYFKIKGTKMQKIKLYTTHCPKCRVLETKMGNKHIQFEEITDTNIMTEKGITSVPMMEVDGKMLGFLEANNYINSLASQEE